MKGIGYMLGILGGNQETVETVKGSLGKTIKKAWLDEEENALKFKFSDQTGMYLFDDGQSCCEYRYMNTDDDLTEYFDCKLVNVEIMDAPDQTDEWGEVHEIQFLKITTDKGIFQMSNHNEHNGYYGGIWLVAKPMDNET